MFTQTIIPSSFPILTLLGNHTFKLSLEHSNRTIIFPFLTQHMLANQLGIQADDVCNNHSDKYLQCPPHCIHAFDNKIISCLSSHWRPLSTMRKKQWVFAARLKRPLTAKYRWPSKYRHISSYCKLRIWKTVVPHLQIYEKTSSNSHRNKPKDLLTAIICMNSNRLQALFPSTKAEQTCIWARISFKNMIHWRGSLKTSNINRFFTCDADLNCSLFL